MRAVGIIPATPPETVGTEKHDALGIIGRESVAGINGHHHYMPQLWGNKIKKVRRKWTGRFHSQTYSVPRPEFHECPPVGRRSTIVRVCDN
jgi:hypothetical protein